MVAAASGQQMVSFDADSWLSSGHTAWLNSRVMGRVHQSMRCGSLLRPRIRRVHVSTTGGITTSGKPLAMYGADDPPYGKSRVNCQVPRPACPSPPTARLTRRLEPPPSCRSVADALYKSDPNKTLQIRRLPLSNWRRKPGLPSAPSSIDELRITKISPKTQIA